MTTEHAPVLTGLRGKVALVTGASRGVGRGGPRSARGDRGP